MTKNYYIAKLVNLVDNEEGKVSDFYSYAINKTEKLIKEDLEPNDPFKQKLQKFKFNRKWLKPLIMTIPYNSKEFGLTKKLEEGFEDNTYMAEYIYDMLEKREIILKEAFSLAEKVNTENSEKLNVILKKKLNLKDSLDFIKNSELEKELELLKLKGEGGQFIYKASKEIIINEVDVDKTYLTSKDLYKLSWDVKSVVESIISPFGELNNYFEEIIKILKIYQLPIFWVTPSYMKVYMSNVKMYKKKIKTSLNRNAKPIGILIPTEQMDYKSIYNGLMPNLIHSLDATNIHILIKNIIKFYNLNDNPNKFINLYSIHDCFATDYKTMKLIEILVRHSFIEIYFCKDYLNSLNSTFLDQIGSCTNIYDEKVIVNGKKTNKKYILKDSDKSLNKKNILYIPDLPHYSWEIDEDKLKYDILSSSNFIT